MEIQETALDGVKLIKYPVYHDERGSFAEIWQAERLEAAGLSVPASAQVNRSVSKRGVIRGIHAEPWDKYITTAFGRIFSAIVDLRPDSPNFGRHATFELGETDALFVPQGYGNSFQAMSLTAVVVYLASAPWRLSEAPYPAVSPTDPDIGINWPIKDTQILSEKDMENPSLQDFRQAFSK